MEFIRLTSPDDERFLGAMEIYEASFPFHEQREVLSQRGIMDEDDYHFDLICVGGVFSGLMLYWETDGFIYLEHFCIHPRMRSRGLGTQALEALKARGKAVILEIDPPENDTALCRLGFYEKNGFVINDRAHIHPPYHAMYPGHRLCVMTHPAELTDAEYAAFSDYLSGVVMA